MKANYSSENLNHTNRMNEYGGCGIRLIDQSAITTKSEALADNAIEDSLFISTFRFTNVQSNWVNEPKPLKQQRERGEGRGRGIWYVSV